jgi:hypothetical protein
MKLPLAVAACNSLLKLTVLKSCYYYQNNGSPPSGLGDIIRFWLACLGHLAFLLQRLSNYLPFKYFGFEQA